jgi:hypothetical protein
MDGLGWTVVPILCCADDPERGLRHDPHGAAAAGAHTWDAPLKMRQPAFIGRFRRVELTSSRFLIAILGQCQGRISFYCSNFGEEATSVGSGGFCVHSSFLLVSVSFSVSLGLPILVESWLASSITPLYCLSSAFAAAALSDEDMIWPHYRELGMFLWRGLTAQQMVDQNLGNEDGARNFLPILPARIR